MAGTYRHSDLIPGRFTANRTKRKIATGLALAAGAALLLAPVAVTAILPDRPERTFALDDAILGFNQDGNVINLALMAADDGQRIYVQDQSGETLMLTLSPGQTQVSAELPPEFSSTGTVTVRVG
jgi:hypothetical protein